MMLEDVQGIVDGKCKAKLMYALTAKLTGARLCNAAEPQPCAMVLTASALVDRQALQVLWWTYSLMKSAMRNNRCVCTLLPDRCPELPPRPGCCISQLMLLRQRQTKPASLDPCTSFLRLFERHLWGRTLLERTHRLILSSHATFCGSILWAESSIPSCTSLYATSR